jgi:hypothetical protein
VITLFRLFLDLFQGKYILCDLGILHVFYSTRCIVLWASYELGIEEFFALFRTGSNLRMLIVLLIAPADKKWQQKSEIQSIFNLSQYRFTIVASLSGRDYYCIKQSS